MSAPTERSVKTRSSSRDDSDVFAMISQQLAAITSTMKEMREEQKDLAVSLNSAHEKIDDVKILLEQQKGEIEQCKKTIDYLTLENNTLKKTVSDLKRDVDAQQQYTRLNCVEIRGVPESKGENIVHVVTDVANAIRFKFDPGMVDNVHRLPGSDGNRPRSIILKFVRRIDCNEMLRLAKVKRAFSATDLPHVSRSDSKVYIHPSLTKSNRLLLNAARTTARECNYNFVWFSNGKVMMRKAQGQPAIHVTSNEQLDNIPKSKSTTDDSRPTSK